MKDRLLSNGVSWQIRCLAHAHKFLGHLIALSSLFLVPTGAHAALSCRADYSAASPEVLAVVSGGVSIAPLDVNSDGPRLTCTATAGEQITQIQTCAQYHGQFPTSAYPFTLTRVDGRTQSGSMTNRLILTPLDGQGNDIVLASTMNSMLSGHMLSTGATGTAEMPIRFRVQAQAGSAIEPGVYQGGVVFTMNVVEYAGGAAGPGCTGTTIPPGAIATAATVGAGAYVTVPPQCTVTLPGAMDFGQHTSIADNALQASSQFSVSCNSASSNFHVYIDEGQNATAGQRRMKRTGSNDYIAYDLLDQSNIPFPTTPVSDPGTQGKYPQTMNVAGTLVGINGRVPAQSTNARAGSYTDRVIIHVQY